MGSVYQRGRIWWVKYYQDGRPYRESSSSPKKGEAEQLLKRREGSVATGTFTGLRPEKTMFKALAADLLNDYSNNQRKSLEMVKGYVVRLGRYFGKAKANQITTDQVRAYIAYRKESKTHLGGSPSNATINRELSALKRMFRLGLQAGKVVRMPFIPKLAEDNVRRGFLLHYDYLRLLKALPSYVQPVLTMGYYTGMRKGEILALEWSQIDFTSKLIRLNPGTTKNKEPRLIPMSGELYETLKAQRQLRDAEFPGCLKVFFNHKTGRPVKNFRRSWYTACKKIGLVGALFHDLRRTGVRNHVRAGVPERVAMSISGHKTRSIFDRYNIVNENDLRAAASAVDSYLSESQRQLQSVVREIRP